MRGPGDEEAVEMSEFQPRIVAFCCYYCAYAAGDLAGSLRIQYPSTVRVVEVPCTGRVNPALVLRAFEEGADGVYVAGCLEGECHFQVGNLRARKRIEFTRQLLDQLEIGGDRLEMFNLSGSMGSRFAEIAVEMTERIKELGPSPIRRRKQVTS